MSAAQGPHTWSGGMLTVLRIEDAALLVLAFGLFLLLDVAWWWFLLLLLAPDIGMLGYLFGPRAGAVAYNLFHHRAVAVAIYLGGLATGLQWMAAAGLVLFGHAGMDRLCGYGLKTTQGFHHTHLGRIGGHR